MAHLFNQYRQNLDDEFQSMKSNEVREFMLENWTVNRMLTYILRLIGTEQSKITRLDQDEQLAEVAEFMFKLNRAADPDNGLSRLVDNWRPQELYESRCMETELAALQSSYVDAPDSDDDMVSDQAMLEAYNLC